MEPERLRRLQTTVTMPISGKMASISPGTYFQSEQGEWTFKRLAMIDVPHRVNTYCRDKFLVEIRHTLSYFGKSTLKDFRKSCFGHFLKLPDTVGKCNQALHYVISRHMEFRVERDPTEIWYYINGIPVCFGRREFALITGLRFGRTSFNPYQPHDIPPNSFYTRVLNNNSILVSELLDRFLCKDLGLVKEDYIKVAKVLFVYQVLFGADVSKPKYVADWLLVLVEDEKGWESFPWGSYSFQKLLHYLKQIKSTTSANNKAYEFYGFSTAFMAWVYCAIPQIGETCGIVCSTTDIPRILRFNYNRVNVEEIGGDNVTVEIYPKLEANDEEKGKAFWCMIEAEGTPFLMQYSHSEDTYKNRNPKQTRIRQGTSNVASMNQKQRRSRQGTSNMAATGRASQPGFEDADFEIVTDDTRYAPTQRTVPQRIETSQQYTGPEDPVFSFTWSQRQAFVHEIGDYVVSRLMTGDFIRQISNSAADRVMSRIGDMLPRYSEFIAQDVCTTNDQFEGRNDTPYTEPPPHMPIHCEQNVNRDPIGWSQSNAVDIPSKWPKHSQTSSWDVSQWASQCHCEQNVNREPPPHMPIHCEQNVNRDPWSQSNAVDIPSKWPKHSQTSSWDVSQWASQCQPPTGSAATRKRRRYP